MRYLVTGGAGFIGSNTVDELVQRGHSVVVLDDLSGGKEDNLAEIRNKITIIKGSITDIEIVRKAMHEAEYVLHLAARTSVPRSVKDPLETNRINIEGTLNVLVAAKEMKVKRVVYAASSAAYGETPIRYLTRRRIERAQDLLRSANLTVTEVCMLVGFASLGSFSSRFTQLVGESPAAYRDRWAARGGPRVPGCYLFMRGAFDPRCTGIAQSERSAGRPSPRTISA